MNHNTTVRDLIKWLQGQDQDKLVVIHCLDAVYPISDLHLMHNDTIGIEIALHEVGEPCNCD